MENLTDQQSHQDFAWSVGAIHHRKESLLLTGPKAENGQLPGEMIFDTDSFFGKLTLAPGYTRVTQLQGHSHCWQARQAALGSPRASSALSRMGAGGQTD